MPSRSALFTIGHSTHKWPDFVRLLQIHGITAVADVRSTPNSRFPHFNEVAMVPALRSAGIRYVFLGKELGARRGERECYVGGKVDYELVERLPAFREGLDRVRLGAQKFRIALLCAEKDPITCHRTILVAKQFREEFDIRHILVDGSLESMREAEERLLKTAGTLSGDLFRSFDELLRRAYRAQGQRIAYSEYSDPKKAETSDG